MEDINFDDFQTRKRKRRNRGLAKFYIRCLDCRALIGDCVMDKYPTCPFCGGANWSNDQ